MGKCVDAQWPDTACSTHSTCSRQHQYYWFVCPPPYCCNIVQQAEDHTITYWSRRLRLIRVTMIGPSWSSHFFQPFFNLYGNSKTTCQDCLTWLPWLPIYGHIRSFTIYGYDFWDCPHGCRQCIPQSTVPAINPKGKLLPCMHAKYGSSPQSIIYCCSVTMLVIVLLGGSSINWLVF